MTKEHLINRDSIYAGHVVKIHFLTENQLGEFITDCYLPYRSLLFSLTDELWAEIKMR